MLGKESHTSFAVAVCVHMCLAVKNWNQLPTEGLGTFLCNPNIFGNRFRKAIINGVK